MKNHDVYFEIYGKKMKSTVLAENTKDAEQKVKDKIIFHKVVEKPKDIFNDCVKIMDDFMDMIDGKSKRK